MNVNIKVRNKLNIDKEFVSQNFVWVVLIILVLIMGIAEPKFFSVNNLRILLSGEAVKGIMAFGIMFAILSKGIDLSPGAVVALVGAITAALAQTPNAANKILGIGPLSPILIIAIGVAIGAMIGAVNGCLVAYFAIPPFIGTLGTQLICRALSKIFANRPVSTLSASYRFWGASRIGGFPVIIMVFFVVFIISAILLTRTRFGKNVYAIGGNDKAARVSGINVERNLVKVYIWCSVCAAIGGILLAGRSGSVDPSSSGMNYELDAIAAATVGGTSHTGGICRVSGVLCGILILGVINNGLVMLKVDDNLTNIVKGLIIVVAVILDMRKNAKKA
jgi:ribose/xylose/arabinose/galactoside ABC-type transport system permease subunit